MDVQARCYSGYLYAEEPRAFVWQGKELRLESIEDAQQEPDRRLFRAITQGSRVFELCYNETTDRWSATEFTL
jgi:hypothetical protein